jgi:hypothetical protein
MARSLTGTRVALIALVVSVCPAPASGLPLFSRSESAPCARCHVAVPALNATGERFLRNGYRAAGRAAHSAGESGALPASFVFEAGETLTRTDTLSAGGARGSRTPGEFRQQVLDVHAAGTAGENVSFHIQASMDSASAMRITVAFVQFDDVVGGGALAIKLGSFEAGLPFLSSARRPMGRDYLAPVEVAAQGFELNGGHAAWSYAVGMMNSSRTGLGTGGRGFNRLEDTYLRMTREFGEQAVGGRMLFDRQDSNLPFHAWLQRLQAQFAGRFGANRFWLVPAYTLDRFDDRPGPGYHQRHQYVMLEALALVGAEREWTLVARLEHEHTTPTRITPGEDHDLEALRLARAVTPNSRVALEWSRRAELAGGPRDWRIGATVQLAY